MSFLLVSNWSFGSFAKDQVNKVKRRGKNGGGRYTLPLLLSFSPAFIKHAHIMLQITHRAFSIRSKISELSQWRQMRTIQLKTPEIPGAKSNGMEIPRMKVIKIWVYLERLFSFPEIPENAVP